MYVRVVPKNPLAPEPEREVDTLFLMAENKRDRDTLADLLDNFECIGCGYEHEGELLVARHAEFTLQRKVKSNEDHGKEAS
jgi:hypothetical protein